MPNGEGHVSQDAVYSELYEEGRYFRTHELTVSTWYGLILLGILAALIAIKSAPSTTDIKNYLSNHILTQIIILFIVVIIGVCAILSVRYSERRYRQIRNYLNTMEPTNKHFTPEPITYTPRKLIYLILSILTVGTCLTILIP